MIRLFDCASDKQIGTISEEDLQFLIDQLEEEWEDDQDYYINRDTLALFAGNGAGAELMQILEEALGERNEMDIKWTKA